MRSKSQNGFTLIELMIVVAIMGIASLVTVPRFIDWLEDIRVKDAARGVADAFALARVEAIRNQNNQIVSFQSNTTVTILDDTDNDGVADVGESVTTVTAQQGVTPGASAALSNVPGDPDPQNEFSNGLTFIGLDSNPTNSLAFLPTGIPVVFSTSPFTPGAVGSGSGGVYLTNGRRDYAIVLNAMGGVAVGKWSRSDAEWR